MLNRSPNRCRIQGTTPYRHPLSTTGRLTVGETFPDSRSSRTIHSPPAPAGFDWRVHRQRCNLLRSYGPLAWKIEFGHGENRLKNQHTLSPLPFSVYSVA